jgi:predicted Zn-dependent protease
MKSPINISSREWELIEIWLDQNDVQGEVPLTNEQLTHIPNLEEKIEHVKKIREEIEDSIRRSKIKEFYKHFLADEKDSDIKSITNYKTKSAVWYTAAAVVVVLVGIYWMMANSNSSEKIFAANFKPDVGLPLRMSTENANGFYEGMLDYKQENYKEAIEKWQVLLEIKPGNDTLNYFLGVAHLALGNAAISLEYLENQERFRPGIFKEDAAWYTALAKIKQGKPEEARVLLQKYPSTRNTNLLNEINSL